jgi:hypothetical protein
MKKIVVPLLIILLLLAISTAGYFFYKYQTTGKKAETNDIQAVIAAVGKLMELPDETPTLATITDTSKLKGQAFFNDAQNGDKVLLYMKDQKAILYRPSLKKIIDVAPINVNAQAEESTKTEGTLQGESLEDSAIEAKPVTVTLYNGSSVIGLTVGMQATLEKNNQNITVATRENASKNTYQETLVVDISGANAAKASELAAQLGGRLATLPEGEKKPATDILIIAGQTTTANPVEPTNTPE